MWILCVQQQHLSADGIGVFVFDLRAKEDDAVLEEGLVDVVVKSKAVAVAGVVVSGTYCPGLIGGAEEFRSGSGVHVDEPTPERLGSRAEISSVRCGRRRVKITDAMESSAWISALVRQTPHHRRQRHPRQVRLPARCSCRLRGRSPAARLSRWNR